MKQEQINKYISLVYSKESPLNKYQSIMDRKLRAAEDIGWNVSDKEVDDIIKLKNKDVNRMIFDYLKDTSSNKFALLISNQEFFWELQQRLMKPLSSSYKDNNGKSSDVDIDDESMLKSINLKNTISEKSDALLERIEKQYKEVFLDKEEIDMAIKEIKHISPESRIKKDNRKLVIS